MFKILVPKSVRMNNTIDGSRLKSNLTTKKTIRFTKRSLFYTILGFIRSHLGELGDIEGFIQLIPGTYKSDKLNKETGIDKIRLKCDCKIASIVESIREPILYFFALSSPPGQKLYKEPRIELFRRINKPVVSQNTFYIQDDDNEPVDFNNELISFTCQLIKI